MQKIFLIFGLVFVFNNGFADQSIIDSAGELKEVLPDVVPPTQVQEQLIDNIVIFNNAIAFEYEPLTHEQIKQNLIQTK